MKIRFGALLAYIITIIISILFMLFLDGPGGTYLLIALTSAFFLSLGLFCWTIKTIKYELNVSENILNKNDYLKAVFTIKKSGFMPTVFIKFAFDSTVHFISEAKGNNCIIIFGRDIFNVEKSFKAIFFGEGNIKIENLIISDYFGIFEFKCSNITSTKKDSNLLKKVKVYPDIPDINGRDDFARSLTDAVSFEDSEETSQSFTSLNGFPGYDHRKYIPGDNLKLINWKLSAKRGELLVRQLEGTGGAEQFFVLIRDDLYFEESQLAAEAMLGIAMIFAKSELPLRVFVYMGNEGEEWSEITVNNVSELFELRYRMTSYNIVYLKKFLDNESTKDVSGCRKIAIPKTVNGDRVVVFAPVSDENFMAFIDRIKAEGKEYQAAVCIGEITDKKVKRIERDNLSIRFTD